MEPILCCACCDHLCSNIPTNPVMSTVASAHYLLQGLVPRGLLLCRLMLYGLVRRSQCLNFGPLRWPGQLATTLYCLLPQLSLSRLTNGYFFSGTQGCPFS